MTNDELKEALLNQRPVEYDHRDGCSLFLIKCKYVSAIIYRKGYVPGSVIIEAELRDKNDNCVYIVDPAKVRYSEVEE